MCEERNSAACVDEICSAVDKIFSVEFEGGFSAAQCRSKIYSVKYDAEFYSAVCRDKIYGAMKDDKIFGTALAGAENSELQNERINLKSGNTRADLKFKGDANSKPAGDANFKFKNSASFGFLCSGNVRSLKSMSWANALSFSAAAEISAPVRAGEIFKYGVMAGISALALASKILTPSIAGEILNLSAAPRTDVELKGVDGCQI